MGQIKGDVEVLGISNLLQTLSMAGCKGYLTIVLEGGFIGPRMKPGKLPISTNEMRAAHRAVMHTGITDVFLYAQRGFYDLGFIGAAQIDRFDIVPELDVAAWRIR